jgi:hypothetical protein
MLGIFEIGSWNCLPGLALTFHPPDLCLLSSWDYSCEPQVSALSSVFKWYLECTYEVNPLLEGIYLKTH